MRGRLTTAAASLGSAKVGKKIKHRIKKTKPICFVLKIGKIHTFHRGFNFQFFYV
jgi:hypothetical protein